MSLIFPYSINGLNNINADEITTSSLSCDTFLDQNSSLFTGVSSNLQNQINTINSFVSTGSTGGGYFNIVATVASGFSTTNPYWAIGGGGVSSVVIPLVNNFSFKITAITFTSQSTPTTAGSVNLLNNGTNVYSMSSISSTSITYSNLNILYNSGNGLALQTISGSGGGALKCTISCQVGGVIGATPNLSIGTVSNLSSGSTPTVSISGTTLNPVLNFGLVQGIQGINGTNGTNGAKGDKGDTGSQGPQGPKGDTGDSSLQTQTNTLAIAGLVSAVSIINDHLVIIDDDLITIGGDITAINEDLSTLDGKTQYMTVNTGTITTSFSSKLTATGDIKTNGYLGSINLQETATTATLGQSTNTQTNIQGNNVYIGSLGSIVYIGGVAYNPFSGTTSFFSQW
jgi:hypothetical protein